MNCRYLKRASYLFALVLVGVDMIGEETCNIPRSAKVGVPCLSLCLCEQSVHTDEGVRKGHHSGVIIEPKMKEEASWWRNMQATTSVCVRHDEVPVLTSSTCLAAQQHFDGADLAKTGSPVQGCLS